MGKKKAALADLGARERQIMDVFFLLGEASVGEVHRNLANPPSYSAVRTMIRLLEAKSLLKHRAEGNKYVYWTTQSKESASKKAIKHVVKTFFEGSPTDAVAALFESEKLSAEDIDRIAALIETSRQEGNEC